MHSARFEQSPVFGAAPAKRRCPASLLKVRLLAYTYGEVYEESLLQEAHTIVDSWDKEAMITEQVEAVKELRNIEENPYPFEEVEE